MNMSHYVVTADLLLGSGVFIIDVILMGFEISYLLISNIKTQFLFSFSQSYPEKSPCTELLVRREDVLHLLTGIAGV